MLKKILLTLLLLTLFNPVYITHGADSGEEFAVLNDVDKNTFNEYKYKITEQYIKLKSSFDANKKIDATIANEILTLANEGFKYLPNDLRNINYLSELDSAIEYGLNYPNNSQYFGNILTKLETYLMQVSIQSIKGSAEAYPSSGNAPLTVTLRANATDPTGLQLENYNYTWWTYISGKKTIIGNKVALNYVFTEEGNYKVFLDVTSNHKNNNGFTDVLPLSTYTNIEVKEKDASIVLGVNDINKDLVICDNDLTFTYVKWTKYIALLSGIILLLLFGYYKIFRKDKGSEDVPVPAKLTGEIEIQEKTRKPSVKKAKTKLTKPSSKQKKTTKKKSTSVNKDVKKSGKSK